MTFYMFIGQVNSAKEKGLNNQKFESENQQNAETLISTLTEDSSEQENVDPRKASFHIPCKHLQELSLGLSQRSDDNKIQAHHSCTIFQTGDTDCCGCVVVRASASQVGDCGSQGEGEVLQTIFIKYITFMFSSISG